MYFLGSIFLPMKARKLWQNFPKFPNFSQNVPKFLHMTIFLHKYNLWYLWQIWALFLLLSLPQYLQHVSQRSQRRRQGQTIALKTNVIMFQVFEYQCDRVEVFFLIIVIRLNVFVNEVFVLNFAITIVFKMVNNGSRLWLCGYDWWSSWSWKWL